MKIGFVPYYQERSGANLIRIDYIKPHLKDYIVSGDYRDLKECDVVIFHSRINDEELVKDLKEADVKIIFDMTDPHWDFIDYDPSGKSRELLDKIMPYVDVVTVPTDELKYTFLQYRTDKIIKIIPDSVNFKTHNTQKLHTDKDKFKICWYGSYGNIGSIDLAREDLERLGLEYDITLVCLYDRGNIEVAPFKNIKLECLEWSEEKTIKTILDSDLAINPRYSNWKSYKSNNKTIKAHALGVPCIEYDFYPEIKRFLDSSELRNNEAKKRLEEARKFSSKKSAEYLTSLCRELTKKIKRKKKIAVVTAIIGGGDHLRDDQYIDPDCDYIAYMDKIVESNVWQIRKVEYSPFNEPVRQAKMYKVLPHLYFPEYDYVLWIDGTVALRAPVGEMIELFLSKNDIAIFPHKVRNCVYEEFIVDMNCARHAYDEPLSLREDQRRRYQFEGLPAEGGLFECGFILRRQTERIKRLNNEWWSEISVASASDQVPFMYSLYKTGVKVTPMGPGDMYDSKWSNHIPHGTVPGENGKPKPYYPGEAKTLTIDDIGDDDEVFVTYLDLPTYHYSKVGKFSFQQTRKVLGIHAKHLLRNQPDKFTVCK